MKSKKHLCLLLAVLLCMSGCQGGGNEQTTAGGTTVPSTTQESTESLATQESTDISATEETTVPAHSPLYLEGYTAEQVTAYFAEVVLDAEYSTGEGNINVVQKWTGPIRYAILGDATQEDRKKLDDLFALLNQIEGLPGFEEAPTPIAANMMLHFYDREDFQTYFGRIVNYEDADGAVEYWYYNETNNIHRATVGYRTDIEQYTRNSVLLEEVINGLGITDTKLREDSITYQGFSQTQELSELDWLIVRLLYHPDIKCGMNLEQCKAVIEKLYY